MLQRDIHAMASSSDMSFLVDMGRKGLGVDIEDTDVEQFYRLGRKEEGKERPLLVKLSLIHISEPTRPY